jgi:hypothetical protein
MLCILIFNFVVQDEKKGEGLEEPKNKTHVKDEELLKPDDRNRIEEDKETLTMVVSQKNYFLD